jgi:hypothetical protein
MAQRHQAGSPMADEKAAGTIGGTREGDVAMAKTIDWYYHRKG